MKSRRIAAPVRVLPPDYHEVHYLKVTEPGRLFWLNVLSVIPLVISGLVVLGSLMLYHDAGAPLVITALSGEISTLLGTLLVLLVLPLHEWMHGLAITRAGHRPRYGIKLLVLYATSDGAFFRRREFIQIALAPLVMITGVGMVMMLFLPLELAQWIALAVILNAAGSIGDIWMTLVALRFPRTSLIQDQEDAMRIFAPTNLYQVS
jgi:hypothetical protein